MAIFSIEPDVSIRRRAERSAEGAERGQKMEQDKDFGIFRNKIRAKQDKENQNKIRLKTR